MRLPFIWGLRICWRRRVCRAMPGQRDNSGRWIGLWWEADRWSALDGSGIGGIVQIDIEYVHGRINNHSKVLISLAFNVHMIGTNDSSLAIYNINTQLLSITHLASVSISSVVVIKSTRLCI